MQVFRAMTTQWRVVSTLRGIKYMGLDYASLDRVLRALRRTPHRQRYRTLFLQLQQIEAEALDLLNNE